MMFGPSVIRLLFVSSPTAIVGGISKTIVDALNGMFWRWLTPHISKKVGVIVPSLADFYTSTSPIFIASSIGIIAAGKHGHPRAVFCRLPVSMLKGIFLKAADFVVKTSARSRVPLFQIVADDDALVSTIATTEPSAVALNNIDEREDGEATKLLAYEIIHIIVVTGEE